MVRPALQLHRARLPGVFVFPGGPIDDADAWVPLAYAGTPRPPWPVTRRWLPARLERIRALGPAS